MSIRLRIDNFDTLPDGGPLDFTANARGFDFGRQAGLDWALPDPHRYISGIHGEVRYRDGGYWLTDVSRNGTYVNGAQDRVKSPYRLRDGDKLVVGNYVIAVEISEEDSAGDAGGDYVPSVAPPPGSAHHAGDLDWDFAGPEAAQPMPYQPMPYQPMPQPAQHRPMPPPVQPQTPGDALNDHLAFGKPIPSPAAEPASAAAPAAAQGFGWDVSLPPSSKPAGSSAMPSPAIDAAALWDDKSLGRPMSAAPAMPMPARPVPVNPVPVESAAVEPPGRPLPAAPPPAIRPGSAGSANRSGSDFIAVFCQSAGIPPDVFASREPDDVARELGEAFAVMTNRMIALLRARAAAKTVVKSSSRTMVRPTDNNALKFSPDAAFAFKLMFGLESRAYLGLVDSFNEGFSDIEKHEFATFEAMQKALARLLEDVAPDAIEQDVQASTFANKKAKAWELFVSRWEAKSEMGDNGILDAYLAYFRDFYDESNGR
ncbi:type VI secretion system FHA domain protein [Hartmannibacter diazotrophicus]|uniref:Type VI secretion system FHA domain protein n=1 Tax=Hartmannibacter diazotrophicus TaxID=1482074 RepID=A0A2C9D6D6_9HYPH|nr:type VI secretion system-associated FHA domain protein TagH [Hartmannibacter diazotrophicus]SON55884.1 type VI secretion system FHA domain protein [Hartmannibacter diazotrophicus]